MHCSSKCSNIFNEFACFQWLFCHLILTFWIFIGLRFCVFREEPLLCWYDYWSILPEEGRRWKNHNSLFLVQIIDHCLRFGFDFNDFLLFLFILFCDNFVRFAIGVRMSRVFKICMMMAVRLLCRLMQDHDHSRRVIC